MIINVFKIMCFSSVTFSLYILSNVLSAFRKAVCICASIHIRVLLHTLVGLVLVKGTRGTRSKRLTSPPQSHHK
uniref:Uncharacterized protein n=1 Tax=Panstrongylus lignarius TaxID=156445 RepID=A0A224XTR3_9HEMI